MDKRYDRLVQIIFYIAEFVGITASFLGAVHNRFDSLGVLSRTKYFELLIIMLFAWFFSANTFKLYSASQSVKLQDSFIRVIKAMFLSVSILAAIIVLIKGYYYSREVIIATYACSLVLLLAFRFLFIQWVRYIRRRGYNIKNFVVIGYQQVGQRIQKELLRHPEYGYNFLGFFEDNPKDQQYEDGYLGSVDSVIDFLQINRIDEVYCSLPLSDKERIATIMQAAETRLIRFRMVPDLEGLANRRVNIQFFDNLPVMTIREEPLQLYSNRFVKRTFDIFFSMIVIICILSWLTPLLAIVIRLESPGSTFYQQFRTGKNYRKFQIWKFRSMLVWHDDDEFRQVTRNDPNVTKIGRFLRRNNLDEMPQFFNVLVGEMSIVGPRPHPLMLNDQYRHIISSYMIRHLVKPGITGLAQINGFRGETRHKRVMAKRVQHDVWYIENWTFFLDLKIIAITMRQMFKWDKNVY